MLVNFTAAAAAAAGVGGSVCREVGVLTPSPAGMQLNTFHKLTDIIRRINILVLN